MARHEGLFPLFPTLEIKRLRQEALNGGRIKTGFANWVKHKKNKRHKPSWFNMRKRGSTCLKRLLKEEHS